MGAASRPAPSPRSVSRPPMLALTTSSLPSPLTSQAAMGPKLVAIWVCVGTANAEQACVTQWPLRQSSATAHALPTAQPEQAPPQSTSVSAPFFTWSLHAGAAHTPFVHTRLAQSVPRAQRLPAAQVGHGACPEP